MSFDLQGARAAGHNDTAIAAFLAARHNFDIERARAEGVGDREVAEFLAARPIGRTPAPPATTQPITSTPEKNLARRTVERVSDVGLDLAKGVVGLGESVVGAADLVTGNLAGDGLAAIGYDPKRTREIIESGYSDQRKGENTAVHHADGFVDTTAALFENPAVALGSVVESAPLMLGSAAAVRATAARLLAKAGIAPGTQAAAQFLQRPEIAARLATVGSAAEGATAAGSIQEQARQQGRTWSESAPYAAAGGAGTALIGKAASKLLPDADVAAGTVGLGVGHRITAREAAGRVGKGVIQEGIVEELPQSTQEQVATNLATGRPWDEKVGSAAAQGMVAGMGMGAGATGARAAADMRAPLTDATTGMELDQQAIDAAVRAALNPVNAQLERIEPVLQQREATAASGDPLDAQIIRLENEAIRAAATSSPEDAVEIAAQLEANGADVVPALLETAARRQQQTEAAAIDQADLLERTRNAPASIRTEPAPVETPTDGWGTRANPPEDTLAALRVPTTGTGWGAPTAQGVAIEQTPADVSNTLPQRSAPAPSAALVETQQVETAQRAEREPLPEIPDLPAPPPVADPAEVEARAATTHLAPQFRVVLPDGRTFGTYREQRDAEGALGRAGADARIEPIGQATSVELDAPAVPVESAPAPSVAPSVAPMLMSSGKPFRSEKLAAVSAKQRRLNMRPVEVPGGWGLVPNTDAAPVAATTAPKIRTFGFDRVKLAQHSFEDLERLRQQVTAQHANPRDEAGHPIENGRSTIHLIDQAGRRKLDALAYAVYFKQQEARRAEAEMAPAPTIAPTAPRQTATPAAGPRQTATPAAGPRQAAPVAPQAPAATPAPVAPAARKRTARAPDARPALLAQIEQAKAKTGDPAAVAEYQDLQARINQARRTAALKKTKPSEARKLVSWADNAEQDLAQLRERIGYVRFTSGGSRYKVLNTPAHLEAFAKKVRTTAAFRTAPADWEAIYDHIETRPGSTEAQLDAGRHAVRDLFRWVNVRLGSQLGLDPADRGPVSVLGSALYDGFAEQGGARLVGQRVESPADLAALAQIYRDPRFETFRVFYTDDTGRIVGEAGYSSRLPAAVYLPNVVGDIQRDAAAYKASGYHVLHNHPSGRSAPSPADLSLTRQIAAAVPGFRAHVVIDFNEYSVIQGNGTDFETIQAPELNAIDFTSRPELAHALLGTMITTPVQVAELAKALQIEGGHSTMVFTRRDGAVQLLVDLPTDLLADDSKVGVAKLKGVVRRAARAVGAGGHRFIVLPQGADFTGLEHLVTKGIFVDVVTADGSSIRDRGTWFPGDFLDSGIKPAARVAEEEPYTYATQHGATGEGYGGRAAWQQARAEGRTKLNYRQWVQVRTPAFIEWFGDWQHDNPSSRAADSGFSDGAAGRPDQTTAATGARNPGASQDGRGSRRVDRITLDPDTGEPRVFFHGTGDDVAQFDFAHPNRKDAGWLGRGAYVTSDDFIAETYARIKAPGDAGPNILPVFVRSTGMYPATLEDKRKLSRVSQVTVDEVTRRMRSAGFDGAALVFPDGTVEAATFAQGNIKSAIGNTGAFDPLDADITREPGSAYGTDVSRGTREQAEAKGYVRAWRGISRNAPFNDSGTVWLTTNREVAAAYAEEVFGYDDPALLEIWYDPKAVPTIDMRRLSEEQLAALEPDEFGNPQVPGIYRNADDSPLGSGYPHTVIHVPKAAAMAVGEALAVQEPGADYVNGTRPGQSQPATVAQRRAGIERGAGGNVPRVQQAGAPYSRSTPPAETLPRKLQRVWQDKFNRFAVIQDWLKAQGVALSEQANAYRAEERMHGRVATRTEDFRTRRVQPVIERIHAAGFTLAQVADFLHAQHAEERNAAIAKINSEMPDGGSGMTTADAQAKLAQYAQLPELVRLANELRAITDDTRRLLLDAGIITQEMSDAWTAAYQHYVPLKGGPEEDAATQGTGKGLTVKQRQKRALGHGTREEWIIENILRDHERAILQVEKNRVGQHLLQLAVEAANPDLITIGEPVKRKVLRDAKAYEVTYHGSVVEVFHNLADAQRFVGQEALKAGRSAADFGIRTSHDLDVVMAPSPVLEPSETQVFVKGHAIRVQFKDDVLARAWNNLGAEHMNVVFRLARGVNTWLSKAYTGYNPEFLGVNVLRDLSTGVLNLSGEEGTRFAAATLANYPKAFGELLRYAFTGNTSNWIRQYRADGGTTGAAYLSDLERIGRDIEANYDEYAGAVETMRNHGPRRAARAAGRKTLGHFVGWIEKLNQAGENAMRLAAYRTAIERGQTRAQAAALAKNSTVNFNRRGELGSTMGALYLFFNPAVQGSASIAHALFRGKHKHQAQALTAGLVGLGYLIAASMGGGDEDEWEKLGEFTKERFVPIRTPNGWVKVPIPYGYGFFVTLGRKLHALQAGEDPAKVGLHLASNFVSEFSVWGAAADAEGDEKNILFLLPTIPQIVASPLINRTALGSPIYPESKFDEDRPDNLKMWRNTQGTVWHRSAETLNAVTGGNAAERGWLDVSPETMRFLWATATGGTGRFITDSGALAWNLTAGGLPVSDIESREVPLVRKFVQPIEDVRGARSRFWKAAGEAREAAAAFGRARRIEDHAERAGTLRRIEHESRELFGLGRAVEKYSKAIGAQRDAIDAVRGDESKSLAYRRNLIRSMERDETKLYDEFVGQFKRADQQRRERLAVGGR